MNLVETSVWSNEQLSLGEGPLTHHLRSSLVWCDINGSAVYERGFTSNETHKFQFPVLPSAAGILDEKQVLVATELDFRVLNLESGATETVLEFPEDHHMRTNDGRVHPSGAFWIGTMAKDGNGRPGAIYRFFQGNLSVLIEGIVTPNSICFTQDGTAAFYTDTPNRIIWKVPTDPATGEIIGEREVHVGPSIDSQGHPDGSVLDGEGNLWNARWGGSAIEVYDPDGNRINSYPLPVKQPTCPAFIGPELDQIVTTSARVDLEDPKREDGCVIKIHTPVKGVKEPIVRV